MKQRVAVTLATVWLASIVGASVPSGETTAFSTPRPPGPSPDQYTPLLRNPRYYSQDDYGQDWMKDEPSRIKVANRQDDSDQGQTAITDSDRSLPLESAPNAFFDRRIVEADEDSLKPYSFQSNAKKTQSELEKEAMRLSSMKVAFDEPIDSEISENSSEEYWTNDDLEEDDVMQQDEFVSDDTFEDEGPGSVEVYKLDLYKDRSILSPKPSRKNYSRIKSKIPKKVEAVDQINWKSKDPEETKQRLPKTVSRFDQRPDEFLPARSSKDRIFGVGGVPELQVGCEGVEGSQRQKRSDSEEPVERNSDQSNDTYAKPSARATPLYLEADYDSEEEEFESIGGNDELFKILSMAAATTDSSLNNGNRGDMDPRVKTPADLDKPRKKDKLPIRGDLGPSSEPNFTDSSEARRNIPDENQSQGNPRRQLLSAEEMVAENVRNKRSSVWGYGEREGVTNEGEKRGHRDGRRGNRGEKRRRRHDVEHGRERKENETRKRNKAIDERGEGHGKNRKDDIGENRLGSVARSQPSNLLRQLPTRKDGRNEDYSRRQTQQLKVKERSEEKIGTEDENQRKLAEYMRRNTPIQRRQSSEDNHRRAQQRENESPTPHSKDQEPQNIRLPLSPHRNNQRNDRYAEYRRRLLEQRRREVGHIDRAAYERELQRRRNERRPPTAERPQNQRQGKSAYKQRSQQEIQRLKALPVSAYIFIDQKKTDNNVPVIGGRFGEDDEISYPGLNPSTAGRKVPNFPSPPTESPPVDNVSPCVWAIINCCANEKRLATCFEAMGCQHGHWDNPCTRENKLASLQMVSKHYAG